MWKVCGVHTTHSSRDLLGHGLREAALSLGGVRGFSVYGAMRRSSLRCNHLCGYLLASRSLLLQRLADPRPVCRIRQRLLYGLL